MFAGYVNGYWNLWALSSGWNDVRVCALRAACTLALIWLIVNVAGRL
jgi:hypothetical protein